jgi:predicted flap endonuclease-1-like 5' DNA nuclease
MNNNNVDNDQYWFNYNGYPTQITGWLCWLLFGVWNFWVLSNAIANQQDQRHWIWLATGFVGSAIMLWLAIDWKKNPIDQEEETIDVTPSVSSFKSSASDVKVVPSSTPTSEIKSSFKEKEAELDKKVEQATVVSSSDPLKTAVNVNFKDDLKKIEGIGPKIEEILNKKSIKTFKDLSEAEVPTIQKYLDEAGPRFSMHEPATWPKQAKLALDGKWEELTKLQDELIGGR